MSEVIINYNCKLCNKYYASYQSLWIHNKKFHNNMVNEKKQIVNDIKYLENNLVNENINKNKCKYCNKLLSCKQSKSQHHKICKQKNTIVDSNIDKKFEEFKNTILEILQKDAKIHPKTLQKINKQLINNGTINNGTINNINNTFVKFGNEQLSSLLTHNDMLKIINKNCLCIEESIKSVHFNKKLPEYNNIFITNMKDTIAYIFDGSKFILTTKDEVINDLYNSHLENIEQFLEDVEIPENKYSKISKFLDILNDNEKCFIDGCNNNKKYSNYKAYKLIAIKNLIYNESDQKLLKKLNNSDLNEKIDNIIEDL